MNKEKTQKGDEKKESIAMLSHVCGFTAIKWVQGDKS